MAGSDICIIKLYAYLDKLIKNEDLEEEILDQIRKYFATFLDDKNEGERNYIMQTVKDEHFLQKREITKEEVRQTGVEGVTDIRMNGDSLLLRAMSIKKGIGCRKHTIEKIIHCLIEYFPDLIRVEKFHKESKGVTPVHLAIVQGDVSLLQTMGENVELVCDGEHQTMCASGDNFHGTVMMAGTLLGIASLMGNQKMFTIIFDQFNAEIDVTNEKGDNIIHSMIKYAHIQPEKLDSILNMLEYILNCNFIRKQFKKQDNKPTNETPDIEDEGKYRKEVGKLLMMKNREQLTPLQLSAKRQQYRIFECIIKHEIYLSKETNGGVFHESQYDITELDTLPLASDIKREHNENIKSEHHESVLEYVVRHQTNNAFLFTNVTPVKEIIREKWQHYRRGFFVGFGVYFVFMIFLSFAAVFRSQIDKTVQGNDTAHYLYLVTKDAFVTFVSVLGLLFAIFFIAIEARRKCFVTRFSSETSTLFIKRLKHRLTLPYSNFMFRVYFLLFSGLLLADFVFAIPVAFEKLPRYENYCLIFAVIIGWYLVLFFLQTFKSFSFYTVLIQRVITDMMKMSCIMVIFLISFSIAMFMLMQGADIEEDDFDNLGKTVVKMITIMLGLGELNVLFQARQPILAVLVFLLFVLLTTILLLNALIAMMSNTCTDLTSNHAGFVASKMHYRLQKLSIILYLESFLPRKLCKEVGKVKKVLRFDDGDKKYKLINRRFWSRSAVKVHGETDIASPEESLELPGNSIDILKNELMETIKRSKVKCHKSKKRNKGKHKVSDISLVSNGILNQRIDIKDIDQKHCETCRNDTVTYMQSQEITRLTADNNIF